MIPETTTAPAERANPPVCIAGMHRSGTSMVARILNLCGLSLGRDEDILPPAADNPDGFWENRRFQEVNERLLEIGGGGWDRAPAGESEPGDHLLELARASAATMSGRWGWKDPRNSVLLPFWQRLFPGLRVVICIRDPLEVVLSLRSRNALSYESSLALWHQYTSAADEATRPEQRLVVHFSAVFDDPEGQARRLASYAQLDSSEEQIRRAAGTVRRDLRHSRFENSTLLDAELHPAILSLYARLSSEAGWPIAELERFAAMEPPPLEGRLLNRAVIEAKIFDRELKNAHAVLTGYREQIAARERGMRELGEALASRDAEVESLRASIEQLQREIAEERIHNRNYAIDRQDLRAQRDALERSAAAAANEIQDLETRLAKRQHELDALFLQAERVASSRGGRMLNAWWRLAGKLRRKPDVPEITHP